MNAIGVVCGIAILREECLGLYLPWARKYFCAEHEWLCEERMARVSATVKYGLPS